MATQLELALMATNVYGSKDRNLTESLAQIRHPRNNLPVPDGWVKYREPLILPDGFMAQAYRRGNEIVIAYAGTTDETPLLSIANNDWLWGNVPAASALTLAPQVVDAAKFYLDILKDNPNAQISFTGHSLGGGLASLMAVYFDHPAVVFDEAPFLKTADSALVVNSLRTRLQQDGYAIPEALQVYSAIDPTGVLVPSDTRQAREHLVQQIYTTGEILSLPVTAIFNVVSVLLSRVNLSLSVAAANLGKVHNGQMIEMNPQAQSILDWGVFVNGVSLTNGNPVDLHSMVLLTALGMQNGFGPSSPMLKLVQDYPELLPSLFNGMFKNQPKLEDANLLDLLVQRQYRGEGALDTLVADIRKIDRNAGLTAMKDIPGAGSAHGDADYVMPIVIDAVLAGLYSQGKARRPDDPFERAFDQVIEQVQGGIRFDLSKFADDTRTLNVRLDHLVTLLLGTDAAAMAYTRNARWTLQSGAGALNVTQASDGKDDVMVGYNQGDVLDGADGDDQLIGLDGADSLFGGTGVDALAGGAGNDLLDGGSQSDYLYGGAGIDTYRFAGSFGGDWVVDSDGQGTIEVDGMQVTGTGAKKSNLNTSAWTTDDWTFTLVSNGAGGHDLILQRDSSLNQIRIRGWVNGQLGITLGDEVAEPQTNNTFNGDFKKKTNPDGTAYEIGADGNYVADGQEDGAKDLITGTDEADSISGLDGDDALLGRSGDDFIDGGSGSDILQGGLGADTLIGGAGHDVLYGSSNGSLYYPTRTDYTPPAPTRPVVLGQGFGWVLDSPGPDGDGVQQSYLSDNVLRDQQAGDAGNIIEGGAGNDTVYAGTGNDIVDAGADDDDVYGMGGSDALAGDDGNDRIYGDGSSQYGPEAIVYYAAPQDHGADVIDGGAGNDLLIGQGQDDAIYGGIGDDTLYGDDRDNANTPVEVHGLDYLDGGDGADRLVGGGRSDELFGGEGNDTIWGDAGAVDQTSTGYIQPLYQGDDYLDGEGGNDYLQGEGGADEIFGGDGNDTLIGDDATSRLAGAEHKADYLDGEAGDDVLTGDGGGDELFGGDGADYLDGDNDQSVVGASFHGNDYLDGEDGNDTLFGSGGSDTVFGGAGDDKLSGDGAVSAVDAQYHGDDYVDGEEGNDTLFGQGGADTLVGGDGTDYLDGDGEPGDVPVANHGNDVLFGDAGADTLVGGAGSDLLDGGTEDDILEGDLTSSSAGHGSDTLDGGAGNDILYGDGGDDLLLGGSGNDWLAGEDQFSTTATSLLSGNDHLEGGEGDDTLLGGNGNDWLDGGSGTDVLIGGSGQDTFVLAFDGSTKEVIDEDLDSVFQLGTDTTAVLAQRWTGPVPGTGEQYLTIDVGASRVQIKNGLAAGTQSYQFSDGTVWTQEQLLDHITTPILLNGGDGGDSIRGGGGDDNLNGGGGDDIIAGGAGMDILTGGAGNDIVDAGVGGGSARGDEGNDTYRFKGGDGELTIDNTATDWATASDFVRFGPGITAADVAVNRVGNDLRMTLLSSSESVVIANYYLRTDAYYRIAGVQFDNGTSWSRATLESRVSPEGTAGNDYLTGTANNDQIHGGAGMDYLYGLGGDDQLFGDGDSDTLYGGLGNDLLDGGAGLDNLDGDVGNDTLVGGEVMLGGAGNDSYIIDTRPTTTLVVSDTSGVDDLLLPTGVTPSSVSVDLTYTYASTYDALWLNLGLGGYLRVDGYFSSQDADSLEQIRFADGTVWNRTDVMSRVPSARLSNANDQGVLGYVWNDTLDGLGGNDSISGRQGDDTLLGGAGQDTLRGDQGNDSISGGTGDDSLFGDSEQYTSTGDGNDQIFGGDGDDSLYGAGGQDTLDGGIGADYVLGGDGDDVYTLSRTSGNDSLYDSAGTDRVSFGADVAPTSVTLWRDGNDLIIAVDQTVMQTRFLSHFASSSNTLDSVQFSDGTVWDAAGIASRTTAGTINAMTGTAGNDVFVVDNAGDTINETLGGTDTVQSSVSWTLGANLENLTLTGFLNLRGTGNSLNNVITGNSGSNVLDGLAGIDTLIGGAGDDTYNVVPGEDTVTEVVGGGNDTVVVATSYTLPDNVETLKVVPYIYASITATGNALNNTISISGSQISGNIIDGGAGADTMITNGFGSTIFRVDNVGDVVSTSGGVVISSVNWSMPTGVTAIQLTGSAKDAVGNDAANILIGTGQNGVLQGLGGDDTLYSDTQASYQFAGTNYWVSWNSIGADTLIGGTGNDTYYISANAQAIDVVVEAAGEGTDTVDIATGITRTFSTSEFANVENLRLRGNMNASLTGDAGANQLVGDSSNNLLTGGAGNDLLVDRLDSGALGTYDYDIDTLDGGDGNDTLTSKYGSDVLDGGAGNDSLSVASTSIAATVLFGRGDGADTVILSGAGARQFVLDSGISASDLLVTRNQRDLVLSFGQGDSITVQNYFADTTSTVASGQFTTLQFADGVALNEQMLLARLSSGNSNLATESTDLLIGTAGGDSLSGLGGDDLILGAAGSDSLAGGSGADTLAGGDGDDSLSGGAGADLLQGGTGNDTYQFALGDGIDVLEDVGGSDSVEFASGILPTAVTVARSGNDLQLTLSGGTDQLTLKSFFSGVANEFESVRFADGTTWTTAMLKDMGSQFFGTAGADTLNGSAGNEKFFGLAGNDVINAGAGNDSLEGGDGNDSLYGGAGQDTLVGGAGDDLLHPGSEFEFDVIRFGRGSGADRITGTDAVSDEIQFDAGVAAADLRFTASGANLVISISGTTDTLTVEQFTNNWNQVSLRFADGTTWSSAQIWQVLTTITGTDSAETLTGTIYGDRIYANGGNDTVDGGAGNDLIEGGSGNDTLTGGAGYDTLDGGSGADRMTGGSEDDVYVVDNVSDIVVEASGGGYDWIESSVSYTLPSNVEELYMTGSANLTATGNTLDNYIGGNAGNNTLIGGAGNDYLGDYDGGNDSLDGGTGTDTMEGGLGDDIYVVDSALDEIYEYWDEGNDLVRASVSFTLPDEVERLTLTGSSGLNGMGNGLSNFLIGNSGANRLDGGAGNDTIDGGSGSDTMIGGLGDDVYYVNVSSDVVTEAANAGMDTVFSSVTLTLAANVENLTLTGSSALNGTGNALANMLVGNSGANSLSGGDGDDTIDGGAGKDTMVGGLGNDTFYVDVSTDVVTEAASGGTDTVVSAITYTLGSNLENLTLGGTAAISGTGNTANNVLTGNGAANTLTGNAGNDTLDGGAGNDSLVGGTGADMYRFGAGYGIDTISENDSTANVTDAVQFMGTVTQADVLFQHVGNNLEVLLNGTSDKIVLQNWYLGTQYQIEEFRFTDGSVLTGSQAQSQMAGASMAAMSSSEAAASYATQSDLTRQVLALTDAMALFSAPSAAIGSANSLAGQRVLLDPVTMPALRV